MIAVCVIGNPHGLRNSATTAYQSASPPMVAASANAATKPKTGCIGSNAFAVTNSASVPANTSVASSLTRRSSAARAASPGLSNENVPVEVMAAYAADKVSRWHDDSSFPSLRAKRSNPWQRQRSTLDCFVALAPRHDGDARISALQKEGPHEAGLE